MFSLRRAVVPSLLAVLLPAAAAASGFGLFQHGGRATGQAGAWTARADDPSAVTYNPAAIVHLDGFQLEAGLDFSSPTDSYSSAAGSFDARHDINFPPAVYLTWKPWKDQPIAFGVGVDSPYWQRETWEPREFPGRFLTRQEEIELAEVHPVVAWALDSRWSLGGGVRYVFGKLHEGSNGLVNVSAGLPLPDVRLTMEDEKVADASVSAWAFDLGVQFKDTVWGWGAELRSAAKASGSSTVSVNRRDSTVRLPPDVGNDATPTDVPRTQSFEIAPEARVGAWIAPYPELHLELDLAYQAWSQTSNRYSYFPGGLSGPTLITVNRDWKDTLSLRLGAEGRITDSFSLGGGIAFEPSPVPGKTLEPGFTRGDAIVYALGASYSFERMSFDLGYSLHRHNSLSASGQELLSPAAEGRYSSRDQVWAASARWRF